MRFEGNFVVTSGQEIEQGKEYQYYESMPTVICNVIVLNLYSDKDGYGFKLKVTKPFTNNITEGDEFEVSAAHGNYAYGGMWRLYDKDSYR